MDREQSTRHVLEGRELIDYLVEKAAGATNAELLHREERRNRRLAALLSVLTFVGIGAIVGAIKMFVQQEIALAEQSVRDRVTVTLTSDFQQRLAEFERRVDDTIAQRVDDEVGSVRRELRHYKVFQELISHSEVIVTEAQRQKIAEPALAGAVEALTTLHDVEAINAQPTFLEAVNAVVDLLVRADRKREIDQIEALLADVLVRHKDIALSLVDHYGELVVSSPYGVERLAHETEALARYARAAREHGYPERALMWELFVAYKANGYRPDRTTEGLVAMTGDLKPADLNEFCYQVALNSDPLHWMRVPDHEGKEIARLIASLLRDHPALTDLLERMSEDPGLAPRLGELARRRAERAPAPEPPPATAVAEEPADANALRR